MTSAPLSDAPAGRARRQGSTRLPGLHVVPSARQRAARVPFALVILFLIGAGLIGLLLLNTVLAQGAFILRDLQKSTVTLGDSEQALTQAVAHDEAPSVLAQRATDLGMVPGGNPAFLRLPDGKILGKPHAAVAAPVAASPSPSPSPSPSADASASPNPSLSASPTTGRAGPTAAHRTPLAKTPAGTPQGTHRPSPAPATPKPTPTPGRQP